MSNQTAQQYQEYFQAKKGSSKQIRENQSRVIAEKTAEFLAAGGEIEVIGQADHIHIPYGRFYANLQATDFRQGEA